MPQNNFGHLKATHMMEEGGSDIVQMPKKCEKATPQLVVPYLVKSSTFPHDIPIQYIMDLRRSLIISII